MMGPNLVDFSEAIPDTNRSALVITPAQGYLEWIEKLPDHNPRTTLESLQTESVVYLIPEQDYGPDKWLSRNFKKIFENELMAWWMDKDAWPKNRSFKEFKRFFNIQFASVVPDMGKGPILRDEE